MELQSASKAPLKSPIDLGPQKNLWLAPLLLVFARTVFAFVSQMLVTLIFYLSKHPDPVMAATQWWTVDGTLVDVGCILLITAFLRKENARLFDLLKFDKKRLFKDIIWGIGLFIVVFPVAMLAGSTIGSLLTYGAWQPTVPDGVLNRHLPLWGVIYSRSLWWMIWSFTEEVTYQGFALPRLVKLTGRKWLAILIVAIGWSLQHSFLPLMYNGQHFLYSFIQFLPLTVLAQILYLRLKRLPPFIVMHWLMDIVGTIMTIA